MGSSQDFKASQESVQAALIKTTKTVNRLAKHDLDFQRTVNPAFGDALDKSSAELVRITNGLLKSAAKVGDLKAPTLESADDIDINWKAIIDIVDSLLEKADTSLDEYTGLVKRKDAPTAETVSSDVTFTTAATAKQSDFSSTSVTMIPNSRKQAPRAKKPKTNERLDWSFRRANILKPQNTFERKPDTLDMGPWKPLLTKKPHAMVPLEASFGTFLDEFQNTQYDYLFFLPLLARIPATARVKYLDPSLEEKEETKRAARLRKKQRTIRELGSAHDTNGRFRYKHPYETEILQLQYPASLYQKRDPIRYLPVKNTTATWVDSFEGVLEMLEELKQADEIAIDLEHHDFRTYNGLLSLMQISTRRKDWIVDTLQPWRHQLEILNEVFADPTKVKVFHGAFMDILWLQRDLGLYVVGLFDTFCACDSLGYPGKSLAYLLKRFADFDADKKYQMADWRIRPLPEEMFYYARSDTHYLLYIYDMLRNELVERSTRGDPDNDLIEQVLQKSKEVSLHRYENLLSDPETGQGARGWFNTLAKSPSVLNGERFAVYRAVHKWRDDIARREDESPMFIMPQHALAEIAKILPPDRKALWSLIHGSSQIVKSLVDELFAVIQDARARGADGPSSVEFFRSQRTGSPANAGPGAEASRFSAVKLNIGGQDGVQTEAPDVEALRSGLSQLWGPVAISSQWEEGLRKRTAHNNEGQIMTPWGAFAQAAAADIAGYEAAEAADEARKPIAQESAETGEDVDVSEGEFNLRTGKKGTAEGGALEPEPVSQGDTSGSGADGAASGGDDEEATTAAGAELLREKKRQRKERKAQRKQAGPGDEAGNGDDDSTPFDYNAARSVLHAQNGTGAGSGKKVFDPYASKMAAAPKGARRMHGEKAAGKTATFKK